MVGRAVSSTAASRWLPLVIAVVAVGVALLIGLRLRLVDPDSAKMLPAEDTFNHMALVREHLRDGDIQPLNAGADLYPPGMHAFIAAAWVYTGADLYEIMRYAPVLFGMIGLAGVALLLWRSDGPIAAFAGTLAFAIAPEVILRSTMMAPTVVDIAIMPFLFLALLETLRGRLRWAIVAAPLALYLVFTHPWLMPILGFTAAAFVLLSLAIPWPERLGPRPVPRGIAAVAALLGISGALALQGCWGTCTGNPDTLTGGSNLSLYAPVLAFLSLVPAVAVTLAPKAFDRFFPAEGRRDRPAVVRALFSFFFASYLFLLSYLATRGPLPEFVDLPRMFGWPILGVAAIVFVALPFLPSPAGLIGGSLGIVTYPFVLFDLLDTPFLPHRTAVYLAFSLAFLVGVGTAKAARAAAASAADSAKAKRRRIARGATVGLPAAILVTALLAGGVYAATPPSYTWYRLYTDCEFNALKEVSAAADPKPKAIIVTGDYQAKLVLAALTTDARRVWYTASFFENANSRSEVLQDGRPANTIYAVVDPHLLEEHPNADTSFLHESPWIPMGQWCPHPIKGTPTIEAYFVRGTRG